MKKILLILTCCIAITHYGAADSRRVRLATTTSTDNSGLLAILLPPFEEKTGVAVDVIAVGTGKALRLGEAGDVDCVLVHARAAEDAFVSAGYGVNRRDVMHNDFVILGPVDDPAGIRGKGSAGDALIVLAGNGKASFISRGDDSGTHKKERSIWQSAGVEPTGRWYKEVGQGMGAVLTLASEMEGYTISDRATYLSMRDKIEISVLVEGDPVLYNPYSIIAVNPAVHSHVKYEEAMRLVAFITSSVGQDIIRNFTRFGEKLFYPDAIP